jgi:hypothetical protein
MRECYAGGELSEAAGFVDACRIVYFLNVGYAMILSAANGRLVMIMIRAN